MKSTAFSAERSAHSARLTARYLTRAVPDLSHVGPTVARCGATKTNVAEQLRDRTDCAMQCGASAARTSRIFRILELAF